MHALNIFESFLTTSTVLLQDKTMKVWDISGDKPEFVFEKNAKLGVLQVKKWWPSAVLQICIGFHADPDPGSQTNADPDPECGQTLKSQKLKFSMKNKLKVCRRSKNLPTITKVEKPFWNQVIC